MADQGPDIDAKTRTDMVQIVAKAFPRKGHSGGKGRLFDVFDLLKHLDQLGRAIGPNGREAERTVAHHHSRHPVLQAGRCKTVPADLRVIMGMNVDKAGRNNHALGIDLVIASFDACANGNDLAIPYSDIAEIALGTGAVDNATVANNELRLTHDVSCLIIDYEHYGQGLPIAQDASSRRTLIWRNASRPGNRQRNGTLPLAL